MKRYFLLVLVSMIGAQLLFAQTKSTIYGTVVDQNNRPISDISVSIEGTSIGTLTDEKGQYTISLPKGEYTLVASSIEYESQKKKISITDIGKKRINITLGEKVHGLDEVMVYGKSTPQKLREGAFSMNVIQIDKLANTSSNVNQILRQTTGVSIREDGGVGSDFTFKINGLDAKIFIDGVPMENFGSSMSINNIPVNLVERIEIYKGVVPAYLGTDVLGGAVNIITKRKNKKFLDLSYGYGSFNTHQASVVGNYTDYKTGLTVKANGFYNYSDNDYTMYSEDKYNVILEKAENGKYVRMDKAKRFHDKYHSIMGQIEAGFEDRKWADRFLFGLMYSSNKKENQLGATVNSVKGGEWSDNSFIMPSLQFRKMNLFTDGLYADAYVSYSKSTTHVRDTATYVYDWSGKWASTGTPLNKVHYKYVYDNYLGKLNLNYDFTKSKSQSISLTYNVNTIKQKTFDLEKEKSLALPARLTKHIANVAWQGEWFNKKLISILSVKYYGMNAKQTLDERVFDGKGNLVSGGYKSYNKYFDYYSGGLALRYFFNPDFGLKASFERAYNLPGMTALFGDGQNYIANFGLKPEKSDNFNLGVFRNAFIGKNHYINVEISGFYRDAKDFINTQIVKGSGRSKGDAYQYYNSPGVKLYGIEGEVKYGYKKIVSLTVNGSYDKAINNWKYTDDSKKQVSLVYKEQLPNRPWVYGNVDMGVGQDNLLGKDTRVELNYLLQYTHWFYLSWGALGGKNSKNYIPTQTVHSIIASYSWSKNKYNFSFEARNLLDERCYDNFRLQKPGRAFYAKFRISLM